MTRNNETKFSGYDIFTGDLMKICNDKNQTASTLNQFSHTVAEKDPEFKRALTGSAILLPDGTGITLTIKFTANF